MLFLTEITREKNENIETGTVKESVVSYYRKKTAFNSKEITGIQIVSSEDECNMVYCNTQWATYDIENAIKQYMKDTEWQGHEKVIFLTDDIDIALLYM